jgi:hypothetical protein
VRGGLLAFLVAGVLLDGRRCYQNSYNTNEKPSDVHQMTSPPCSRLLIELNKKCNPIRFSQNAQGVSFTGNIFDLQCMSGF